MKTQYSNNSTLNQIKNHVGNSYSSPANLNINWCYGSSILITLIVQILSGLVLATFYAPVESTAFKQVLGIANLVSYGAEARYLHRTNVSLIFIFLYMHIFRGRFYGSYAKNKSAWVTGLTLFILIRATAFTGYVLPWGQRSFWGAVVITNLISVIPEIGYKVLQWFWGGNAIGGVTLYRFYVLHFTLPFIILFLSFFHIKAVHEKGSSEPLGLSDDSAKKWVGLAPNFIVKDIAFILWAYFALYLYTAHSPDLLVHCINYEEANRIVTPKHIVPEWYLLPFYGILRSIDNKLRGRVVRASSFGILFLRPWRAENTYIASARFNFLKQRILYTWASVFFSLGYLGKSEPIAYVTSLGQFYVLRYFLLIILIFVLDYFEQNYDENIHYERQEMERKKRLPRHSVLL